MERNIGRRQRDRKSYGSHDSRSQAHILSQCRLVYAVRVALGRLHHLSRLFANDVGVVDDSSVAMCKVRGLELHQHAILRCILFVAQQRDIALCVVVSEISARPMARFLPRNARRRQ